MTAYIPVLRVIIGFELENHLNDGLYPVLPGVYNWLSRRDYSGPWQYRQRWYRVWREPHIWWDRCQWGPFFMLLRKKPVVEQPVTEVLVSSKAVTLYWSAPSAISSDSEKWEQLIRKILDIYGGK